MSTEPTTTKNGSSLTTEKEEVQTQAESPSRVLPRSAWQSQVAYLRVLFRAKKALDRIEKEGS